MNTSLKKIAVVVALALATPAAAQTFVQPLPKGQKYRDAGTKPATGRSGAATIEARALMDIDGKTDIEVTTGRFEGIGGGGTLGKVQVKLFSGGALVETDNYRLGAAGNGTATFSYDGLNPGYSAQVQANVAGIEANRTDVVTVNVPLKRRPDLEAVRLSAQPQVVRNAPVTVRGMVAETNGDVGARATCRLFADGTEIGRMAGVWIDASSAATCEFRTSFASLGRKNLTMRLTDVEPRDYDGGNNEISFAIDVVNANVPSFSAEVWQDDTSNAIDHSQTYRQGGVAISTYAEHRSYEQHVQWFYANSTRFEKLPLTGHITFRHASGGAALPSVSVAVQDLPIPDDGCRYGVLSSGLSVSFCAWEGVTSVDVFNYAGFVTYVQRRELVTSTGQNDWSDYWTYSDVYAGTRFPLTTDYSAELLHETEQGVFGGSIAFPLEKSDVIEGTPYSCVGPVDNGTQVCDGTRYHTTVVRGFDQTGTY